MKIIETRPREIGFVLWDHCQNLLDDPRILVSTMITDDEATKEPVGNTRCNVFWLLSRYCS